MTIKSEFHTISMCLIFKMNWNEAETTEPLGNFPHTIYTEIIIIMRIRVFAAAAVATGTSVAYLRQTISISHNKFIVEYGGNFVHLWNSINAIMKNRVSLMKKSIFLLLRIAGKSLKSHFNHVHIVYFVAVFQFSKFFSCNEVQMHFIGRIFILFSFCDRCSAWIISWRKNWR